MDSRGEGKGSFVGGLMVVLAVMARLTHKVGVAGPPRAAVTLTMIYMRASTSASISSNSPASEADGYQGGPRARRPGRWGLAGFADTDWPR